MLLGIIPPLVKAQVNGIASRARWRSATKGRFS